MNLVVGATGQLGTRSTSRVPIIMTPSVDPVAAGIVESVNRPGGNITGITEMMPELTPQRLALLKQIVPQLNRVAILWKPGTLSQITFARMLEETQDTARALGIELRVITAAKVEDFDAAFSDMHDARVDGLIVLINPMFNAERQLIIARASNDAKARERQTGLVKPSCEAGITYVRMPLHPCRVKLGEAV